MHMTTPSAQRQQTNSIRCCYHHKSRAHGHLLLLQQSLKSYLLFTSRQTFPQINDGMPHWSCWKVREQWLVTEAIVNNRFTNHRPVCVAGPKCQRRTQKVESKTVLFSKYCSIISDSVHPKVVFVAVPIPSCPARYSGRIPLLQPLFEGIKRLTWESVRRKVRHLTGTNCAAPPPTAPNDGFFQALHCR